MSSLYTQDTPESLLQIGIWTEPVSGQLVQALKRVLQGSQDGVRKSLKRSGDHLGSRRRWACFQ